MLAAAVTALGFGYLMGSLPFGYLVARAKGVNIFEVGSKNPGATNVRRVLGSGPGNIVLFLDALKGAVASAWALLRLADGAATGTFTGALTVFGRFEVRGDDWIMIGVMGLVGAMLGHSFSCFTGFRGGKGVATGAGGFAVVFPLGALVALVVWLAVLAVTRFVSLASMLAAISLPVTAVVQQRGAALVTTCAAVALFVILRHRANISRILAGTESKIGRKASATKS